MSDNKKNEVDSVTLEQLFEKELVIPEYQRPYEWSIDHVQVLLKDLLIYVYQQNKEYITGNIILHKEDGKLNIVDGQQRTVTFSLLLYALNPEIKLGSILQQSFNKISQDNLEANFLFIKKWVARFDDSQKGIFLEQLKSKVKFFYTEVQKIEEAFQLFDSQNTRGKRLSATDLLKAYHLQNIEEDISEKEKLEIVIRWEELSKDNQLHRFLENHLFRIRKWIKGEWCYFFNENDVSEFKGLNPNDNSLPNFIKKDLLTYYKWKQSVNDISFSLLSEKLNYPFQIDQTILNGKNFFDYVFYYYDKFKSFKESKSKWSEFYNQYCIGYPGWWIRIGDFYLRNLFENFSFYAIDRFSMNEYELYFKKVYKNFYFARVKKSNSKYTRVTKKNISDNISWLIEASNNNNLSFLEDKREDFSHEIQNDKKHEKIKEAYVIN